MLIMSEEKILYYEVSNRVATLTINRPEVSHSYNWELMNEFYNALINADNDENVRCILIKSTGEKVFSAGIDIKSVSPDDIDRMNNMRKMGRKITETMLLVKKPIIAQVQGSAIGFGFEILMACDLKIFADKNIDQMFFRMPEIAIAIYPQTGATILPLLTFGLPCAKNMLLTADDYELKDLQEMNIPTRIFPPDKLDIETKKFLRTFSKRDYAFSFLMKVSLNIMNKNFIQRCYDLEDECGKIAYEKKSMKELDDFIKELYKKYP